MANFHDGYYLDNTDVVFYKLSPSEKTMNARNFKVDQDKVMEYEAMCLTYLKNFMTIGWLRLHTPIERYQEELGTNFLYVPKEHRARIAEMLQGGRLIIIDFPNIFSVIKTGKQMTLAELIGSGELIDIFELGTQYRKMLAKGEITEENFKKKTETIAETKFHIECFRVQGMFIEK